MTNEDRKLFGLILLDFDQEIDGLDLEVFKAAYNHPARHDLDSQRDCAMNAEFQPWIKVMRDRKMEMRNVMARLLGFQSRKPHDLSPRDYIVVDGLLVPAGTL